MNRSQLSLNTITVQRLSLRAAIDVAAELGIAGIAPWRHQLEDVDLASVAATIKDAGLTVTSVCRGGMFTAPDRLGRAAAVQDNLRAIEQAAAVGAHCLVLVCGPVVDGDVAGSWSMVQDGIAAVSAEADAAGVRLAIEALHPMMAADRSVVCRLDDATDLAESIGPRIGVIVDAYHVWWERSLPRQLRRAGGRIAGVHVSDWVSPLSGALLTGRGMIGDGVIDLPGLVAGCRAAGYQGLIEAEILSDHWWSLDARTTLDTLVDRFEQCV